MTTLIELRKLAEAATAGPWIAGDDEDSDYFLVGPHDVDKIVFRPVVKLHDQNDALFIAAANPAQVLSMLDTIEALQAALERSKESYLALEQKAVLCKEELLKTQQAQQDHIADASKMVPAWQPIETAPRDGTCILLADGRTVTARIYDTNGGKYPWLVLDERCSDFTNGWQDVERYGPKFWMPLPPALEAT